MAETKSKRPARSPSGSKEIDRLIAGTKDWRGQTLARVRKAILAADPAIVEAWKWMGSPVWECDGIIAVGNAHKEKVKLTFANGAQLADPQKLFNNGFGGSKWRAIDISQGQNVDDAALTQLVRAAIAYNRTSLAEKAAKKAAPPAKSASPTVREASAAKKVAKNRSA